MLEVNTIHDANWARGDKVAADDSNARIAHGGIGQPSRESCLDVQAQLSGRLLGAFEGGLVGDSHTVAISVFDSAQSQLLLYLRA